MVTIASAAAFDVTVTNHWNGGFQAKFTITPNHALHGWRAHLICDRSLDSIEIWRANVVEKRNGGKEFVLVNTPLDPDVSNGGSLEIEFAGRMSGDSSPSCMVTVDGVNSSVSHTTQHTPVPTHDTGTSNGVVSPMKYDYGKALGLSILFYDAQRSGRLPANNPIPWRGDSAVNDGDNGHDLSGGWYDAGDHVKFNLPMAMSTHILLWGFIKFQDAYRQAGQTNMMCDMIKWPLDYFLKCWIPESETYYVQVGDGGPDHGYWGRPENMNMWRPAFKVTASNGGSDVAGDTASAFAAGYIVFNTICGDTAYANRLLQAGKSIYEFAKNHQKIYSQSVPQAAGFYGSGGFRDELSLAAAWLYKATNDGRYLNEARQFHDGGVPWSLSWEDKRIAGTLLLYEITQDGSYKNDVMGFVRSYKPGGGITYTPCGLAYRDQWGANRYAANAAFIAVMAAADGIETNDFVTWAMSQINYILGDNKYHISYEIGFGSHYPEHPHHRGSSCPTSTNWCDAGAGGPNPNLLKGALVGGPDNQDNYDDRRGDYVKNEVACDYNAGFQGALAGLLHFAINNALPAAPGSRC
ncbi:hypothetical protein CHS0354_016184 [Potamilus streckersoni]|uniref:Endoglucanase n=1 Tax=Potamilus streckersoni TaxID=2493646 RepID=A0AAE0VLQ5_9BIVA|nr:hypothetical protein CHS0354_016184 [Potamilus streckersoni]